MMKDFKKFRKKKDGIQKNHQTFLRLVSSILIFYGFMSMTSYCQGTVNIKASVSGTLNCNNIQVTLNCNAKTNGLIYKWTGPNGYVSTSRNSVTSLPGDYKVSVTDPLNGKTLTASVLVILDTISPKGITVNTSGMLTCKDSLITLTGNSATPNVSYEWTGPEGFMSSEKKTVTYISGNYQLKVVNPANGCVSRAMVMVSQNIKPPEDVSALVSGVLSCKNKSVKLIGLSSTKNVNYEWTGPGFTGKSHIHNITVPGNYHLNVTDPLNGCSSTTNISVTQSIEPPSKLIAKTSGALTCKTQNIMLQASSATRSAIYEWSGPKGVSSFENSLVTNVPGDYTLKATDPENSCSANKKITVVQDTIPPAYIKVTSSGILTCNVDSVVLACTTPAKDVTFDWTGPNGYTSKSVSPKVTQKGTYNIKATKISNGCSITKSINVAENKSSPEKVIASSSGSLSCMNPDVKLIGKSSTERVSFVWTGPHGYKSDVKEPEINLPGKYTLTAIDTTNGCICETSITVSREICMKNEIKRDFLRNESSPTTDNFNLSP